jgi:homoserine kinase
MVLIRDNDTLDIKKLHIPHGMYAAVIYPHVEVLTRESRGILKPEVNFKDVIRQQGNLGAFVAGMYTSDFGLISRSLQDLLVEPQRAHLIPHFYEMKEAAMHAGALGFSISGAGPSMFALCDNSIKAESVIEAANKLYQSKKVSINTYLSKINHEGAIRF